MNASSPHVGLFVSCLIDNTRPEIGFACLSLLQKAGCRVSVPLQTCCGQPAYNNGNRAEAVSIAKTTIKAFEQLDAVIVPSASCAGMIKHHYPPLFQAGSQWRKRAEALAENCEELTDFLANLSQPVASDTVFNGRIYFHQSCSARREMQSHKAMEMLTAIRGAEIMELPENEACCGFGGLFSVKFDEISNAMVSAKAGPLKGAENAILTGQDWGCLLNIGGKLARMGEAIPVYHIAELLAGPLCHTAQPHNEGGRTANPSD